MTTPYYEDEQATLYGGDARHTAAGLGRLLRWTARAYLLLVLPWIYATHTPDMTGWHWLAAAIATPLALIAMPTPKERP